jgi:hypothetical protein
MKEGTPLMPKNGSKDRLIEVAPLAGENSNFVCANRETHQVDLLAESMRDVDPLAEICESFLGGECTGLGAFAICITVLRNARNQYSIASGVIFASERVELSGAICQPVPNDEHAFSALALR